MTQLHYRTCHLCETMCGLEIEHDGDRIVAIRGDKKDVLSRGNICPKATGLQDIHTCPDRLKKPLKRVRKNPSAKSHDGTFQFRGAPKKCNLASPQSKYYKNPLIIDHSTKQENASE